MESKVQTARKIWTSFPVCATFHLCENAAMDSEIGILKAGGLSPKPEHSKPAPLDARVARQSYSTNLKQFKKLVARIESYCGGSTGSEVSIAVLRLIDEARNLALDVREQAIELGDYPTCFIMLDSGVAYFSEIAAMAEKAHESRLSELERLEISFGKVSETSATPFFKLIDLRAHDTRGGHLWSRHIHKSMDNMKQRFLEEEERRNAKRKLSSFFDEAIAQEAISRALWLDRGRIGRAKEGEPLYISINEVKDIGYVKERGKTPVLAKSGLIKIIKDSNHPDGCRIITAILDNEITHDELL